MFYEALRSKYGLLSRKVELRSPSDKNLCFLWWFRRNFSFMGRTGYRPRKRKFNGNQHTEKSPKSSKIEIPKSSEDLTIEENATNQSTSERKIKANLEVEEELKEKIASSSLTGYRLMDMEILADVFCLVCCKDCGESNIQLSEISIRRHGCASYLRLLCFSCG